MNQTYIPSCLRNLPKQKAKPRKQAIKDAKAEVIDQAIQLLREELRSGKLEGMMMPYQRGYLSAISKLEVLKWICPYISRHLLSLNPLQARCRRYSRGER